MSRSQKGKVVKIQGYHNNQNVAGQKCYLVLASLSKPSIPRGKDQIVSATDFKESEWESLSGLYLFIANVNTPFSLYVC